MTEKARIYFDVDGVFNACARDTPEWGWDRLEYVQVNGFPITYSPDFVDFVNGITMLDGLGVYWLTTWCFDAPTKLGLAIGLDAAAWPVVGHDHWLTSQVSLPWWKHRAIVEHLDDYDGPVLWVDDDLGVDPSTNAWLAGQSRVLTLAPRTVNGVTRREAEVIEQFVSEALK